MKLNRITSFMELKMHKRYGFTIFFLAVGLFVVSSLSADCDLFCMEKLKPSTSKMKGHYDGRKTNVSYTVTAETYSGKPCFRAVWDTKYKKIDMWFWPNGRPIRTQYDNMIDSFVVQIEYTSSGAIYKYTKEGKTTTTKLKKKNLIETLALDLLLLSFPFEKGGQKVFYGIDADSDDGDTYKFYVKLDKVETIKVAGESVKAYKVKLGLKGFIGMFAPTYYFWYSVSKPHQYLKYEGPSETFVLTEGNIAL